MQRPERTKPPTSLIGVVVLLAVAGVLAGLHLVLSRPTTSPASTGASGLATVRVGSLPKQAQQTLQLIAAGGPFPYPRDGIVFANREGILPREASGYYHEYTVVTPGSSDRGARRVIAGRAGEEYYTDDHYASFREIVP